jgi:1-phosphofructokinase
MIVTLTPNPSLDRTIAVDQLQVGEVHRASGQQVDPGGKGVNVSRALAANSRDTLAIMPAGGAAAVEFGALLDEAHVPYVFIDLPGAVRSNITLVESDGETTKINEAGRESTAADAEAMLDVVVEHAPSASWVVGCGSLPPGLSGDLYVDLIARARAAGAKVAIDSSGAALTAAVAARPDLIKPNQEELEEFVGRELHTLGDVVDAARALIAGGISEVVVSLGEHGAVAISATEEAHASAVVERPLSTVGAGDCLLAGWLGAREAGASFTESLATAVRWGAAAVALPGSRVPGPEDLAMAAVTVVAVVPRDMTVRNQAAPAASSGR